MRTFVPSRIILVLLLTLCRIDLSAQESGPFTIGYMHRIRLESWDNTIGLSKTAGRGTSYIRNRMSLCGVYSPLSTIALTAQLTNENRWYFVPETEGFKSDEIFVDLLNVKWDSIAALPLALTVGRQNIMLGEGFVVMDGGPLDGSRSIYFNAIRVDWRFGPTSVLSAICVSQPAKDTYLPIIHKQDRPLVESPERGIIIQYSGKIGDNTLQPYFIHKSILPGSARPVGAQINSPGLRAVVPLTAGLSMTGEAAYQTGAWGGKSMRAYGGYLYGKYSTGWNGVAPTSFTVGGILLSGDKEKSDTHEGWDPLFSRWPKWSESYIYAQAPEGGPAYWTNFSSLFGRITWDFSSDIGFSFDYHHITAPQTAAARVGFPGGLGGMRGHLFIAKVYYVIRKNLTGHALFEGFRPGDYYFDGASGYGWGRLEVLLTI